MKTIVYLIFSGLFILSEIFGTASFAKSLYNTIKKSILHYSVMEKQPITGERSGSIRENRNVILTDLGI